MNSLANLGSAKTAEAVKRIVKTVGDTEKTKVIFCKIHTPEDQRKHLCSEQNALTVQAHVNDQLNTAGVVENECRETRKQAAAKIYAFWLRKRSVIVAKKSATQKNLF